MDNSDKGPGSDRAQRRGFRGTDENAKTKICMRWQNGNCRFGDRCNFAHGDQELRQLPPRSPRGGGAGGGRGRGGGRGGYDGGYRDEGVYMGGLAMARGGGRGQVGGYGRGTGRGGGNGGEHRPGGGGERQTSWDGAPVHGIGGWIQYQTETGEKYFHNPDSGETQWEPPAGWRPLP